MSLAELLRPEALRPETRVSGRDRFSSPASTRNPDFFEQKHNFLDETRFATPVPQESNSLNRCNPFYGVSH